MMVVCRPQRAYIVDLACSGPGYPRNRRRLYWPPRRSRRPRGDGILCRPCIVNVPCVIRISGRPMRSSPLLRDTARWGKRPATPGLSNAGIIPSGNGYLDECENPGLFRRTLPIILARLGLLFIIIMRAYVSQMPNCNDTQGYGQLEEATILDLSRTLLIKIHHNVVCHYT